MVSLTTSLWTSSNDALATVGASVAINVVFDYGLDKVLANFDRRRIFLEGEALHMDRKKRQWADQQNELDKVLDVLQFPDSDCARKHATIQDATQLDSEPRHWFLDSDEFREWSASNPAPGLFWIHGKRKFRFTYSPDTQFMEDLGLQPVWGRPSYRKC